MNEPMDAEEVTPVHTILGAGGVVGRELSRALAGGGPAVRQVSRTPRRVSPTDEVIAANLLDPDETSRAVKGSRVVYLVAGLEYSASAWEKGWPLVMRNVINACRRHRARLVFLDKVYAYGPVDGLMTEATPFNPSSRKGEVRARIATMRLDEMRVGNVQALIARSADFYGPGAIRSFPHAMVFERVRAGKAPQWIGDAEAVHTFTFTPDVGRAMAILGRTAGAYGQSWHLPTSKEAITGADFVRMACDLAGQPYRILVPPRWVLALMGTFVPVIRENREMMHQMEQDYCFDSSKIEAVFGLEATSYRDVLPKGHRGRPRLAGFQPGPRPWPSAAVIPTTADPEDLKMKTRSGRDRADPSAHHPDRVEEVPVRALLKDILDTLGRFVLVFLVTSVGLLAVVAVMHVYALEEGTARTLVFNVFPFLSILLGTLVLERFPSSARYHRCRALAWERQVADPRKKRTTLGGRGDVPSVHP